MKNRFTERILPWLDSSSVPCVRESDLGNGIYVYGAGDLGVLALEYCEACNIQIKAFLDRASTVPVISKSGREYPVCHPDATDVALDRKLPVAVAIATSPYAPIADQLRELNWEYVMPFYNLTNKVRGGHPLRNGWGLGVVSRQEKEEARFVCKHWSDEISWHHYEAFLAWHRDNTEIALDFAPINPSERYVIPELLEVLQNRRGLFVDVGSHCGESIARLNSAGIVFREYDLFEPDPTSRSILMRKKEELVQIDTAFVVHPDVLGEEENTAPYQEGLGYCSQQWTNGTGLRDVVPLDSFDLKPDFLKVHTEGSELAILKGASKTIERYRPMIAYSVYHRREGFYIDISEALRLFRDYRWFFRLHSYQGTGAFVYAVPN